MTVTGDNKDLKSQAAAIGSLEAEAGPSAIPPPPSFEESTTGRTTVALRNQLLEPETYVSPGGEEPPPAFTPYEAEYFVSGSNGDIVSHDKHLNEDGEALYRFLLSHAQTPPSFCVRLCGTHMEEVTRSVTRRNGRGELQTVHERHSEEVVDFDFSIDIGQHIIMPGPVHWIVPDEQPAYRGSMVPEVDYWLHRADGPGGFSEVREEGLLVPERRRATRKEIKQARAWQKEREARGLPPWAASGSEQHGRPGSSALPVNHIDALKSSRTLRQWADDYCASDKYLKEFTYEKIVYGWHFRNLQSVITAAVKSTYYTGDFSVKFRTTNAKIYVRPDNKLSRALSNKWIKFFLYLLIIVYPLILLYKRFHRRGGGRWEVCGGAYALKEWQFVEQLSDALPAFPGPPPPFSEQADPANTTVNGRSAKIVGLREGEWFQQWESTIRRAVTGRLKSSVPLRDPDPVATRASVLLDGYTPPAVPLVHY